MQMNRQTSWLLTIFILLTTISFLDAQNLPEIAIGSRSFSLGQVATMSNTDVLNSINNPAALSKNNAYGFSLFYSRPIENTYNPSLGFYLPFYDFGTVSDIFHIMSTNMSFLMPMIFLIGLYMVSIPNG
jgi:hypothetical protein